VSATLAVVRPAGQELAVGSQSGGTPEKPGAERAKVAVNGSEGAKGGQDLSK
jgi:hypothetical protein